MGLIKKQIEDLKESCVCPNCGAQEIRLTQTPAEFQCAKCGWQELEESINKM